MEHVNFANLEYFTALHCICIAIISVFYFWGQHWRKQTIWWGKRANAGSASLWGDTWGWWFRTGSGGAFASLFFSSPLNQKLVLSEELHTDMNFLKIRKTYRKTWWSNAGSATYFPYFPHCPEKLTCFSSEMEKHSKQIWDDRFAFSWLLRVSGQSSSRM